MGERGHSPGQTYSLFIRTLTLPVDNNNLAHISAPDMIFFFRLLRTYCGGPVPQRVSERGVLIKCFFISASPFYILPPGRKTHTALSQSLHRREPFSAFVNSWTSAMDRSDKEKKFRTCQQLKKNAPLTTAPRLD